MFVQALRQRGAVLFSRLTLAILAALFWVPSRAHPQISSQYTAADLDLLLAQKQYPQLEDALAARPAELPSQIRAYFEGVMANRLNLGKKSIALLEPLIPNLLISDPVRGEMALCAVADDYAKSFRYGDAARIYSEANRIAKQQNKESACDAAREASRWALLNNAPAQTVVTSGQFTIRGKWDTIGLFQVQVNAGAYAGFWIVDSGANLSVVSKSVADKLGLEVSSFGSTAEGSSGLAVPVHTAVIPEMQLGPAVFHNAPVLVVADSDLSFPSLDYRIEGSLGLPVLAALGKVTFYRDGRIQFDHANQDSETNRAPHNLFLERFAPLIIADFGSGNQLFTIDTGALGTMLSAQFYEQSRGAFDSSDLVNLELVGAGGTLVAPAYQLRGMVAKLGGSCARLKTVQLLTQPTGSADEFYGNIGQSALSSFTSVTFDFNAMHFNVSGGNPGNCSVRDQP